MRRAVPVLVVAAAAGACQLVLPIHEQEDGGPDATATDATDAPPPDVGLDAPEDAAEAGDASPVNLLENPTFSDPSALVPCGSPWGPTNANVTLSLADASVDGQAVCLVCVTSKTGGVEQQMIRPDGSFTTFDVSGQAWVAATPAYPLVHLTVHADVHFADPDASAGYNVGTGPVDGGGRLLSASHNGDYTKPLDYLNFSVTEADDGGGCFLVSQPVLEILP